MKKILLSLLLGVFFSTNFFWVFWTSENFSSYLIEEVSAKKCSEQTDEERANWLPCSEDWIRTLEKNESELDEWISRNTLRESIMEALNYFLILLWILWVLIIIYTWVQAVVWWEEEVKNAKWRILWVVIWFVIIFLSYSVVNFIWNIWWDSGWWEVINTDWWNIVNNTDKILVDEEWNPILTPDWKTVYVDKNWKKYYINEDWNKILVDEEWNPILTPDWNLIYLETKARIFVDWKEVKSVLRVNILDSGVKWILFDPSKSIIKEWKEIIEYTWEFWDWNKDYYETAEPVRQFYDHAWEYILILSIKDSNNNIVSKRIRVIIENLTADIKINPDNIYLWAKIFFDWSESKSSDWKISSYKWEIKNSKWKKERSSEEKWFSFIPKKAGVFTVWLMVKNLKWKEWYIEKIFTVNSNKPKSMFTYWNKSISMPWVFIFDWWSSYDMDWDVLKYSWDFNWDWKYEIINWDEFKVMYSYDEVWDYNVYLKVTDEFWEFDIFNQKVTVRSILNVDFDVDRYASQKWWNINFTPIVPVWVNSILWDFKDWKKETTSWLDKISHTFNESWIYTVKMTAINRDWEENSIIKKVFIWDWEYPVGVFQIFINWEKRFWKIDMCWEWKDWIEITRLDQIEVNAKDSINLDNTSWWLSYTWDFWDWEISETQVARHRYKMVRNECYPIKISVKDNYSKKVAKLSDTVRIRVVNKNPVIWSLQLTADKDENWEYVTPLNVNLNLNNTFDEDWNIVKYKWYYKKPFTDEKLWYIETFTKNVKILIEADWVKWLTNDYIFNVEVEDNEWWISSFLSNLNFEQNMNNRISVKNWETKSLNLDFEINKTQFIVWEQAIFRVKNNLKNENIVYSWDFDWDEELDVLTKNKIIEHVFDKKWIYKIELRIENNWIFERVYKTVYVDEKNIWEWEDKKNLYNNLSNWTWWNILESNQEKLDENEKISTDLWIKLKWEWNALTSLNIRSEKYKNNKYQIVAHILNSDASIYDWKVEFQIIKGEWEILNSEIDAVSSIAKTIFIKKWNWLVEIKIIAKDTIYWKLEEKIIIE